MNFHYYDYHPTFYYDIRYYRENSVKSHHLQRKQHVVYHGFNLLTSALKPGLSTME